VLIVPSATAPRFKMTRSLRPIFHRVIRRDKSKFEFGDMLRLVFKFKLEFELTGRTLV
jgi:hypothetical protein